MRSRSILVSVAVVAVGIAAAVSRRAPVTAEQPATDAYVDNARCLECHPAQGRQWRQSHHALAMAPATAESVRGDFRDATFTHQGVTSRFFRRGESFFVSTDGPDGGLADFELRYTFGVEPLQQYLIAMPGGRLQALQLAWDTRHQTWFSLRPDERAAPGDALHWTGRSQTANTMCLTCHTTGFEKRYDAATDTFASRWAEPNVSCQACHGPGARHVQWAQLHADGGPAPGRYGLSVEASRVETCAPCHSRRTELTAAPTPGQPWLNDYLPSLLTEGLYSADGQQLDEVFVDGSFRQSKMYRMGVVCTSCHDAHTGRLKAPGNAVCLQCHTPKPNPVFATAAGNFDTPAHHFHKQDSAGAQCVGCHMPARTYMQLQPRLDHSIRIPRPDLSVTLGTPNACTTCHADRSAQWAADQVAAWYGPRRRQEPHYGQVFAAARAGEPHANDALARLAVDAQGPAIVRATALAALRGDGATGLDARLQATRDPDPEVRAAAAESLEAAPPAERVSGLLPLLRDPIRAVRIAAALSLSSTPLDAAQRPAFDAALAEYVAAQSVSLDTPGARLNLAVVHQNTGRQDLAEREYLAALALDPDFTPARANLAQLYAAASRNADAERVLSEGLARQPDTGELQYSLGLLLAEEQRLPEAAAALTQAARLLPQRARVHYNLGLALQQLGRRAPAEAELLAAQRLDTQDPAVLYALAVFYVQGGQQAQALAWAEKLQAVTPADPGAQRLIAQLRATAR